MADHEYTITKLSVTVSNEDDKMTAVINFTKGSETFKVTASDIPHDEIRGLLTRLRSGIDNHPQVATLVGSDEFTVELIP